MRGWRSSRPRRSGQPREGCEGEPQEPARCGGSLHFLLELAGEEGELERLGDAAEHRASLLGERNGGLEEPLHLERRSDLDTHERRSVAVVGEVVRYAGRDQRPRPASRRCALVAAEKRIVPSTTSNRSSWSGWRWRGRGRPPGGSSRSIATSSPFVSAEVARKVIRSPLAGSPCLSWTAMSASWLIAVRPVLPQVDGLSMTTRPQFMTVSPGLLDCWDSWPAY